MECTRGGNCASLLKKASMIPYDWSFMIESGDDASAKALSEK